MLYCLHIALINRTGAGQQSMQMESEDLHFLRLKCLSSEEWNVTDQSPSFNFVDSE